MNTLYGWRAVSIVLFLACIFLAYRVFDQGITRTYIETSVEDSDRHSKILTDLIEREWYGWPEDQVISRLNDYRSSKSQKSLVLKRDEKSNAVYLEMIRFEFQDGKLVRVTL